MMMMVVVHGGGGGGADNDDIGQPMYYHKSKNLNVSALKSLQKNAKFNDIEVDTDVSTIHVPTHVYDECTYIRLYVSHRTCWSRDWNICVCIIYHTISFV